MENIVLLSIDCLRADMASSKQLAPNLDRLRKRTDVYTTANWTLPAHTSALTGRWPVEHGKRGPTTGVGEVEFDLLPEVLKRQGYNTFAYTREKWFEPQMGLARGWDVYVNQLSGCSSLTGETGCEGEWRDPLHMQDEILRDLKEPFFLFLHTFLVHNFLVPERIPDRERWFFVPQRITDSVFEKAQHANLFSTIRDMTNDGRHDCLTDRDYALLTGLYKGHLLHTDRMIGQFLSRLPNVKLIVMSDHGTMLGEMHQGRRQLFHRYGCPSPIIGRVPLFSNFDLGDGPLSLVDLFELLAWNSRHKRDKSWCEFWNYNDHYYERDDEHYSLACVNGEGFRVNNEEDRKVYESLGNRCNLTS